MNDTVTEHRTPHEARVSYELPSNFRLRAGHRTWGVFFFALALALLITFSVYRAREDVFLLTSGSVEEESTAAVVASAKAAPRNSGARRSVNRVFRTGDVQSVSFWAFKLLYQGPIPYLIALMTLFTLIYTPGLLFARLVPWGSRVQRDVKEVRNTIERLAPGSQARLDTVRDAVRKNGYFAGRLDLLQREYQLSGDRESVREANDRLTATEEARVAFALQPLIYAEWMLPILGFIGTVWGVAEAVSGLRTGINALFEVDGPRQSIITGFDQSFQGLILAFDTTLFGLVGLAIVGTMVFFLRKNANNTLLAVDRWANEAIGLLKQKDLLHKLIHGLFNTNDKGELVHDKNGRPQLRWQSWMDALQAGFFETDADGKLRTDDQKRPIPRSKRWMDLILTEFFYPDKDGHVYREDEEVEPVSKSAVWRSQIHRMLLQELYQVTEEEAHAIATGLTDNDEQVPLMSRMERRHREIDADLRLLTQLVWLSGGPGGGTAGANRAARSGAQGFALLGERIIEPNGHPVDAIGIDRGWVILGREEGEYDRESCLHTGRVRELLGGEHWQWVGGEALTAQEPVAALACCDGFAYLGRQSGQLVVRGATPGDMRAACVLGDASAKPKSIAFLRCRGMLQVVAAIERGDRTEVYLWPADGSAPPTAEKITTVPGRLVAFAAWQSARVVVAVRNGSGGTKLTVLTDEQPQEPFEVSPSIRALSFSPDGALWFCDGKGSLGIVPLDGNNSRHLATQVNAGVPGQRLALTAASQAIVANIGESQLRVIDCEGSGAVTKIRYPQAITALGQSADGRYLLVGCADGSVYLKGTQTPVRVASDERIHPSDEKVVV